MEKIKRRQELNKEFSKEFDFIDRVENLILSIFSGDIKVKTNSQILTFALGGKAVKTFRASKLLCEQGFGPEAVMLCRSLIEILLVLSWVNEKDSESRAQKYAEYEWVVKEGAWKRTEKSSDTFWKDIAEKIPDNSRKIIKEKYSELVSKYPDFKDGKVLMWTGESMSELAKRFGISHYADFIYPFTSQLLHSNPNSFSSYSIISEVKKSITVGPSDHLIKQALLTLGDLILRIAKLADVNFQLQKSQEIENIQKIFNL